MKKNIVTVLTFLLLVCLISCSPLKKNSPSTNLTPSLTFLFPNTKMPELTPSPTLNSSHATSESYVATKDASVYATLESRAVKCADDYQLELPYAIDGLSNDSWSIFTCSPKPKDINIATTPEIVDYGNRYTQITKTDLSTTWIIQHDTFDYSSINRPDAFLSPFRWTEDGNYVYLVTARYPGPSGGNQKIYFHDGNELYRLNLNSGKFEIVLPPIIWGYSYSLSPDNQYLAYSLLDENQAEKKIVHIRNMNTGLERKIILNGDYALTGAYAWKPDSTKLFFASALSGWENEDGGAASLFMLTLKNMYLQTILLDDSRFLVPHPQWEDRNLKYWTDEDYLYIHSLNYETVEYFSDLALDVQSGNIIVLVTPDPTLIGSATPKP